MITSIALGTIVVSGTRIAHLRFKANRLKSLIVPERRLIKGEYVIKHNLQGFCYHHDLFNHIYYTQSQPVYVGNQHVKVPFGGKEMEKQKRCIYSTVNIPGFDNYTLARWWQYHYSNDYRFKQEVNRNEMVDYIKKKYYISVNPPKHGVLYHVNYRIPDFIYIHGYNIENRFYILNILDSQDRLIHVYDDKVSFWTLVAVCAILVLILMIAANYYRIF